MFEIKVPALPPTINHCYGYTRYGCYLKKPGKDFKMMVHLLVKGLPFTFPDTKETYSLSIEFHSPVWRNKDGSVKKRDASNLIKIAEDAFIEAIGIDDSRFWEVSVKKVFSKDTFTTYYLS